MRFEYQKDLQNRGRLKPTYTDDLLDSIFDQKSNLEIDINKELDVLNKLKSQLESEHEQACMKRDSIVDWDSDEASEAEDVCFDLYEKLDSIEDLIDYLEELKQKL